MLMIEQSYALLAPVAGEGQQTAVLMSDDGCFEACAQALADGGGMQMLGITVNHDEAFTRLVFDFVGRLAAVAASDLADSAEVLAREELRRKGVTLVHRQPLVADSVAGPRRTSVLRWGDGLSLRVKRLDAEDGASWLQLRVQMDTAAADYVHVLLTDAGSIVSLVTGRTDQDAWSRIQGELNRQGYAVS